MTNIDMKIVLNKIKNWMNVPKKKKKNFCKIVFFDGSEPVFWR